MCQAASDACGSQSRILLLGLASSRVVRHFFRVAWPLPEFADKGTTSSLLPVSGRHLRVEVRQITRQTMMTVTTYELHNIDIHVHTQYTQKSNTQAVFNAGNRQNYSFRSQISEVISNFQPNSRTLVQSSAV
jgi:hypothetical protein